MDICCKWNGPIRGLDENASVDRNIVCTTSHTQHRRTSLRRASPPSGQSSPAYCEIVWLGLARPQGAKRTCTERKHVHILESDSDIPSYRALLACDPSVYLYRWPSRRSHHSSTSKWRLLSTTFCFYCRRALQHFHPNRPMTTPPKQHRAKVPPGGDGYNFLERPGEFRHGRGEQFAEVADEEFEGKRSSWSSDTSRWVSLSSSPHDSTFPSINFVADSFHHSRRRSRNQLALGNGRRPFETRSLSTNWFQSPRWLQLANR